MSIFAIVTQRPGDSGTMMLGTPSIPPPNAGGRPPMPVDAEPPNCGRVVLVGPVARPPEPAPTLSPKPDVLNSVGPVDKPPDPPEELCP